MVPQMLCSSISEQRHVVFCVCVCARFFFLPLLLNRLFVCVYMYIHTADIKELPSRIVANFDRIRELDERVQNLQRQVDETTVHRALLVQQRESVAAGGETGTAAAAAAVTGTGTEAAATREEALPQTRDDGDEKTPGEDEAAGASAPSAEPAPSDAARVRRLTTPGASPLPSPTMQPARQSKRKVEHDIMETERTFFFNGD